MEPSTDIKSSITRPIVEPPPFTFKYKWLALLFGGLVTIGPSYAGLLPSFLIDQIEANFGINSAEYNLIYTIGNVSSLFMPLVAGYLIDVIGARRILIISLVVITVAQLIMVLAAFEKVYFLFIAGRVLDNTVSSMIDNARYKLMTRIFSGKDLTLCVIVIVISELFGTFLNGPLTVKIANSFSLAVAWVSGVLLCLFSLLCTFIFIWLHRNFEKTKINNPLANTDNEMVLKECEEQIKIMTLNDIKKLSKPFWSIAIIQGLLYGGVETMIENLEFFLENKFGLSEGVAAAIFNLAAGFALLSIAVMGVLIHKIGKRAYQILAVVICLNLSLFLFQVSPSCNGCASYFIPAILLGFGAGGIDVLSKACLPLVTKREILGVANGIVSFVENIFAVASPYFYGLILDHNEYQDPNDNEHMLVSSFTWPILYLQSFTFLALLSAFVLNYVDWKEGRPLHPKGNLELDHS